MYWTGDGDLVPLVQVSIRVTSYDHGLGLATQPAQAKKSAFENLAHALSRWDDLNGTLHTGLVGPGRQWGYIS